MVTATAREQWRSHVSKIVDVHLSFMALQMSNYSGQRHRGEKNGEGMFPIPVDNGIWESVVSCPSGVWGGAPVASDIWAFYVQFYAILRIF